MLNARLSGWLRQMRTRMTDTPALPPAGWYDVPAGGKRFWNGREWSTDVIGAPSAEAQYAALDPYLPAPRNEVIPVVPPAPARPCAAVSARRLVFRADRRASVVGRPAVGAVRPAKRRSCAPGEGGRYRVPLPVPSRWFLGTAVLPWAHRIGHPIQCAVVGRLGTCLARSRDSDDRRGGHLVVRGPFPGSWDIR